MTTPFKTIVLLIMCTTLLMTGLKSPVFLFSGLFSAPCAHSLYNIIKTSAVQITNVKKYRESLALHGTQTTAYVGFIGLPSAPEHTHKADVAKI